MKDSEKNKIKGGTTMKHINKERLVKTFCELASISSPSGQEERIAKVLSEKLEKLGLAVQRDSYGNLIAKLTGEGEPIVLCAHMDTVAVAKDAIRVVVDEEKGIIKSDGTTILGADNKDSIAAIFEALTVITGNNFPHIPVEIILSRQEEDISKGVKNLDLSLISGKQCIISDQAEEYGTVTLTAPYLYIFNVEIQGVKCHVKEPEKGINAVQIMASAISNKEMPLGRIDHLTTVNIGNIVAGLRDVIDNPEKTMVGLRHAGRNSIPDIARVYGEVRGANEAKVLEVLDAIEKAFTLTAESLRGSVNFSTEKLADGYIFQENDPLVRIVTTIFTEQNARVNYFDSVGGSDANVLEARGLHSVVFSSAHRNNHRNDEYLITANLELLSDFYVRLITKNT